ncbi:MAG: hypothetical protein LC117_11355 [Bacteroidia bacterium]|nr:hypothetical protein [Bacteroidia bacterium]MCZ2278510.1 hypothetical protein [Bacteroidia bacterium]
MKNKQILILSAVIILFVSGWAAYYLDQQPSLPAEKAESTIYVNLPEVVIEAPASNSSQQELAVAVNNPRIIRHLPEVVIEAQSDIDAFINLPEVVIEAPVSRFPDQRIVLEKGVSMVISHLPEVVVVAGDAATAYSRFNIKTSRGL